MPASALQPIGVIGLGIMGSAYAQNLLAAGIPVIGADLADSARAALAAAGGSPHDTTSAVAGGARTLLLALPSADALRAVVAGIAAAAAPGTVVAEMSTLPLEAKTAARDTLAARGIALLDCPVSGTGAQAKNRDLVIFASGPERAFRTLEATFAAFARDVRFCG